MPINILEQISPTALAAYRRSAAAVGIPVEDYIKDVLEREAPLSVAEILADLEQIRKETAKYGPFPDSVELIRQVRDEDFG